MNYIFVILGISIFIFFFIILSILYIIINNYDNKTEDNEYGTDIKVYREYKNEPDYNLIYSKYQLLGTLSSVKSEPETIILPLYGKRIKSYRWKYYTKVNNGSSTDLRIDIQKLRNNTLESCMKECEMIENGETIKIPAYTNTDFIVQLYEYEHPF